eukprot:544895-Pelagomonas_calceolata.AAC.3
MGLGCEGCGSKGAAYQSRLPEGAMASIGANINPRPILNGPYTKTVKNPDLSLNGSPRSY